MPALRILHVAPYGPEAWAYGGIPRVVAALTRTLASRGHHVTLCVTDVSSADQRLTAPWGRRRLGAWAPRVSDGVTTRVYPNLLNCLAYRWQCFTPVGLHRFLREHIQAFDLAHLHACRNLPVSLAARQLDRTGVPFVLAPNGTLPRIERRRLLKTGYDWLMGPVPVREAAAVLAVSDAERRQLLASGVPPGVIHHIPNPVDLQEFTSPIRRGWLRARLDASDAPLVLFLGKLTPRKRVDLLVEAFARLQSHTARLVIAGNDMGALATIRAAVGRAGLGQRVAFTGLLPGPERLFALRDADVVVYPSDHEVFGLVPLEALLCGTPVVVADDSGCGEIIGAIRGGLVTPLGDVTALSAAIQRILDSPDVWRARAEDAATRVRHAFGHDGVTAQLEALYRRVCSGSTRRVATAKAAPVEAEEHP